MEPINAALRFSGVRWTVAFLLSLVIGDLAVYFLSYPPDQLAQWPAEALNAVSKLIEATARGSLAVLALWFLWGIESRVLLSSHEFLGVLAKCVLSVVGAMQLVFASWALVDAAVLLWELPPQGAWCAVQSAARVVLAPFLIGLTPLAALEVYERFAAIAWLRRVTKTGRGAWGGWISAIELKKYCQPLPRRKR